MTRRIMIVSCYEIGAEIGSGSFGTVNIAEHRTTGEKVAVKCISKSRIQKSNMGSQVKKEITTMKKLDHPNIVRIKEVLMSNSHLYLVLEYAGGGELFSKIATRGKLSENLARRYFRQIMEAVSFCHSQYICHRDIKPENVLLDDHDNVKIADFGFASIMEPENNSDSEYSDDERTRLPSISENTESTEPIIPFRDFVADDHGKTKEKKFKNMPSKIMQKMSTMCGTTHYMAPEIVNRDSYRGDKADIWSCGVVLYVLLTGHLPFDSKSSDEVINKIKGGGFHIPTFLSDLARSIITDIMTPNPLVRPGARTILRHEWFRDMTAPSSTSNPVTISIRTEPVSQVNRQSSKLVAKEERKVPLGVNVAEAVTKIVELLRANTWMQKLDCESEIASTIKASKMTSTGLAMIQVLLQKDDNNTTTVEIDVFGKNKQSGAHEINKLIRDVKALNY